MADGNNFQPQTFFMEQSVIVLFLQASAQLDGSLVITRGSGIDSIDHTGTGAYTINFSDSYDTFLGASHMSKWPGSGTPPPVCWIVGGNNNSMQILFTASTDNPKSPGVGQEIFLTVWVGNCTTRVIE